MTQPQLNTTIIAADIKENPNILKVTIFFLSDNITDAYNT